MNSNIPEYEPTNKSSKPEIEALYPSTAPPAGEERMTRDVFLDTGTTMRDFEIASKAVSKVLKGV